MTAREYYGIDAPTVVRNLGIGAVVLLVAGIATARFSPIAAIAPTMISAGVGMAIGAAWMLASSLWLKRIVVRRMVGERRWSGDEETLDVGCGRGLVAVEAAKRAPRGTIHALDLWQATDLSGNTPEALRANAQAGGVEARLIVDTGDARNMPYPDASFDVVTSMTAIHNIPDAAGRQAAIAEIWRVTRPGGQILLFDIRHARAYLRQLRALGAVETKLHGPILLWGPLGWRFTATRPAS